MFRFFSPRTAWTAALAIAAGVSFPGAVQAQAPRATYVPPDVKGFGRLQMTQPQIASAPLAARPSTVYLRPTSVPHTVTPAAQPQPSEVDIVVRAPQGWNPPASVAIRGLAGELLTFPVVGGQAALNSRVVIVRPGQSVTIQLLPAKPR